MCKQPWIPNINIPTGHLALPINAKTIFGLGGHVYRPFYTKKQAGPNWSEPTLERLMLGDWGVKRGLPGSSGARLPTHPPNTNCSICNRCWRRPKKPLTDPVICLGGCFTIVG